MSNSRITGLCGLAVIGCIGGTIRAGVIINDGGGLNSDRFEYATQAAFETAWPVITAPGATLTSLKNNTPAGAKSITFASGVNAHNRKDFTGLAIPSTTPVMFSFDFWDNTGTGNPQKAFSRLADTTAPSAANQYVAMGTYNNLLSTAQGGNFYMAKVLGGAANGGTVGDWFKLNDSGAPLRSAGWHNLKVIITGVASPASETYKFYVDEILSETVTVVGTQRGYDNVAIGPVAETSGIIQYYDNMKLINDALALVATTPNHNGDSNVGTDNGSGGINVALDWANNGNDKWNLFVWKSSDPVPTSPTTSVTSSDATVLNLDPGTAYSWRVDSFNLFDDKATGNVWSFNAATVPEPVAGFALLATGALALRRRRD